MLDTGCIVMDWINLALDRDHILAVVMRVKNPAGPQIVENFLTIRATSWLFEDSAFWSESQPNCSRPDDATPQFSEAKCVGSYQDYTQLRFSPAQNIAKWRRGVCRAVSDRAL